MDPIDKESLAQQKRDDEFHEKRFQEKLKTLKPVKNPANIRFYLPGVHPDKATRIIQIDMDDTVEIVKVRVVKAYKVSPPIIPEFIFKGKLLSDEKVLMDIGINVEKDYIRVMITVDGVSIP